MAAGTVPAKHRENIWFGKEKHGNSWWWHLFTFLVFIGKNTKGNIRFRNEKQAAFLDEDIQLLFYLLLFTKVCHRGIVLRIWVILIVWSFRWSYAIQYSVHRVDEIYSRAVRASGRQCRSRNCPDFATRILRHSGIWGAADEAVSE